MKMEFSRRSVVQLAWSHLFIHRPETGGAHINLVAIVNETISVVTEGSHCGGCVGE